MKVSTRRVGARRSIALLALAALTSAMVPSAALAGMGSAYKQINLKQKMTFGGQSWLVQLTGWDYTNSGSDSVYVSFSKSSKKKNSSGKLVYNLRESQSFSFTGLAESTVTVDSDLLGSIKLGDQLPDRFSANITLTQVAGKSIQEKCNGNIKSRVVRPTDGSSMNFQTKNSVFGDVKKVPSKGLVTTNNGKCSSSGGHGCPHEGRAISGSASLPNGYMSLGGNAPSSGSYGTVDVYASKSPALGQSWSVFIYGKVLKSRISVENDLSSGSVDYSNLPRLSGKLNATAESPKDTGAWQNCGKDQRSRTTYRYGSAGGTFELKPTGENTISLAEGSEKNSYLNETEVGNRP